MISQEGYTPVHFAVKKDIPVRLIFKQFGEVGCGNELWIEWGAEQPGHLLLHPKAINRYSSLRLNEPVNFRFTARTISIRES